MSIENELTIARLRRERAADMCGVKWDEVEKALPHEFERATAEYRTAVAAWCAATLKAAEIEVKYLRAQRSKEIN